MLIVCDHILIVLFISCAIDMFLLCCGTLVSLDLSCSVVLHLV